MSWAYSSITILAALCLSRGAAQTITVGAAAGTGLTQGFDTTKQVNSGVAPNGQLYTSTYTSTANRGWILGPKIQLHFSDRFSLGMEALHRELRWTNVTIFDPPVDVGYGTVYSTIRVKRTSASWEFPILARYRLAEGRLRPYAEAGPTLRPAGTGTGLSHYGASAGGGVEWQAGGFCFSPGLRYTRWAQLSGWQGIRVNQLEFVAGVDHGTGGGVRPSLFGRKVSAGVVIGVAPGADLERARQGDRLREPESNGLIAGLMLEAPVYRNLSVEVNGLYRPRHATDRYVTYGGDTRFAVLTWEFPVLAKYKLTSGGTSPFVEAGPSFRAAGNLNDASPSYYGATIGAGAASQVSRFQLSPEVRYTRWGADRLMGPSPLTPRTHKDQVSILFGFSL